MISTLFNFKSSQPEAQPTKARVVADESVLGSTPSFEFVDLPDDCIVNICAHFLKPIHIAHLSATCHRNKFVLDYNLIWRHQVEQDFGLHWKEWEKSNKVRDGPSLTIAEDEMLKPGQYRKIYKHLEKFQNILELDTEAYTDRYSLLKMLTVGDSGVGKTSLVRRLAHNDFTDSYFNTIGVDFLIKYCKTRSEISNSMRLKLQIWDTAGRERFRTITSSYYRGTHVFFIAFSVTDRHTFANVRRWMDEIERYSTPTATHIAFLVGTKADDPEKRQVSHSEAAELARELGVQYFETSSKTGEGVERLFLTAASIAIRKVIQRTDGGSASVVPPLPAGSAGKPTGQGWISSVISRIYNIFK